MLTLLQFVLDHLDQFLAGDTTLLTRGVYVKKLSENEIEITVNGTAERWVLNQPDATPCAS